MVLNKVLDQYLSSYQILTKSIKGFGNNEVLKTLTFMDNDANTNTNADGSTIALLELCSGQLKMEKEGKTKSQNLVFFFHTIYLAPLKVYRKFEDSGYYRS